MSILHQCMKSQTKFVMAFFVILRLVALLFLLVFFPFDVEGEVA